ncbi:MAG TPA: NADP-dependent oxidoreductase [Ktedonobacterales bacterium]
MRAIVIEAFGDPDVLQPREIDLPEPGPGQVRVAIYAAGTNPVETGNRRRARFGIQLPAILGCDASGVVDALGPGVTTFAPGDEVFYMSDFQNTQWGTYAEYQVVGAAILARKPRTLSHIEAAALPLAGGTAYETIIRRLALTEGEWVLLYGAAGGVGILALQIAVAQGAHVIAVAREQHHPLLRKLGAAACLDYTTQDVLHEALAIAGRPMDAVADLVGGQTIARSLEVIRPFGRAATIAGIEGDLDLMILHNLTLHGILVRPDQARLEALRGLVDTGHLRPIIDQVLPLKEVAQAHRRLESSHGRGKIILQVR